MGERRSPVQLAIFALPPKADMRTSACAQPRMGKGASPDSISGTQPVHRFEGSKMQKRLDSGPAISTVDERRILELEQRSIRIASSTFEEGEIADLYASRMADIGLDVEMMEVTHPQDPAKKSRQPIGRLRGTGGGPTLMLNGHMDPGAEMTGWTVDPLGAKFEDGWIWGIGAHDDKGGCVAAISAVEAVVRSGTRLRGDVIVTPVIAHKLGGAGTRALLDRGVKADLCINMEHSNNTIANVCVGGLASAAPSPASENPRSANPT